MQYTGPPDAVCPITLAPLHEMELPVVFVSHPAQPYEADALAQWLHCCQIVPHSGLPASWQTTPLGDLVMPLSEPWVSPAGAKQIEAIFAALSVQPKSAAAVFDPPATPWQVKLKTNFWLTLFAACLFEPLQHYVLFETLTSAQQQCPQWALDMLPVAAIMFSLKLLFLVHTIRSTSHNYPLNGLFAVKCLLFCYLASVVCDKMCKEKPWWDESNTWKYHVEMVSLLITAMKFAIDMESAFGGRDIR